eukprot:gene3210-4056_t
MKETDNNTLLRGRATSVCGMHAVPDLLRGDAAPNASSDGVPDISSFLKGKTLLISGATGFLAKVLVEKILHEQPEVQRVYLLIQPTTSNTAEERLEQLMEAAVFNRLRDTHGDSYRAFMQSKLSAVSGTIAKDGLGLLSDVAQALQNEVDVVVHSAATTTFDESFDVAVNVNTLGATRVLSFAQQCRRCQLMVHVSTAYVNGLRIGPISERPFKLGDCIAQELRGDAAPSLDVNKMIRLAATLKDNPKAGGDDEAKMIGLRQAKKHGWQDTYVFTKAMGEMLVGEQRGSLPVAVVRPSIVESALREPVPGWIEGIRMVDPFLIAYGRGQMQGFVANKHTVCDVIPVDTVVNTILGVMPAQAGKDDMKIFQVGTSTTSPLTFGRMCDITSETFARAPMLDRNKAPIEVDPLLVLPNQLAFVWEHW